MGVAPPSTPLGVTALAPASLTSAVRSTVDIHGRQNAGDKRNHEHRHKRRQCESQYDHSGSGCTPPAACTGLVASAVFCCRRLGRSAVPGRRSGPASSAPVSAHARTSASSVPPAHYLPASLRSRLLPACAGFTALVDRKGGKGIRQLCRAAIPIGSGSLASDVCRISTASGGSLRTTSVGIVSGIVDMCVKNLRRRAQ